MAQFEGVRWADRQMRYMLTDRTTDYLEADSRVFAVSRSIHYGLFLAFEGIRFFCQRNEDGKLELVFVNWHRNLERFMNGIAFNLGFEQKALVPTIVELEEVFLNYFRNPDMHEFLEEMAETKAQGYLRPFTIDEEQSIGVTFPSSPSIRAVACRYDRYLGEPFDGVVIPSMVRVIGINGTGCLKLGINYLMSVKAVDKAKSLHPEAASALFLDDDPSQKVQDRTVSEWDSSCCLIALKDGRVIKIPESPLILPSVTIQGVMAILRDRGVTVDERDIQYGELIERSKSGEIVDICSVGTAGILNRCHSLLMIDMNDTVLAKHSADESREMHRTLGELKDIYWNIYVGSEEAPPGITRQVYTLD